MEGENMIVTSSDVKFVVDTDRCCGCKVCVRRCIEDVWHWDPEKNCAVPKYPDECVLCYQCEMDCKNNCIEVIPQVVIKSDPLLNKPQYE
ncbi:MAG: ferredoxin family protein [Oscillospiraceae bacterium]|nr:ferredoxin family protein [Oscillospiraceae bacterium]